MFSRVENLHMGEAFLSMISHNKDIAEWVFSPKLVLISTWILIIFLSISYDAVEKFFSYKNFLVLIVFIDLPFI